jgi:hypothetical protein
LEVIFNVEGEYTMLTQKTFNTKDSNGCEFRCKCQLVKSDTGRIEESHYYGMDLEAHTLKELQDKVATNNKRELI